ncbi:MAG: fibronectin type III domain-containing protein [Alphaproteobacteria bacterium]|nr:fibronectin type III domain-containing protein [Alphaproteobacteria bacterium]
MGRADRARRERHSRRPTSRLRRVAAGVASSVPGLLRRPARAVSLAAPLALLLATLGFAAPAQAQTTVKLVGNTSQSAIPGGWSFERDLWQPFTTGSSPTYKLTAVDIELSQVTGNPAYTLSIETHTTAKGHFSFPGTHLVTLDNPGTLVAGLNRHTVPGKGIDLAPNTTYRLLLDVTTPAAGDVLQRTDSGATDADGQAGWGIVRTVGSRDWSSSSDVWSWGTYQRSLKFALHGHVQTLAGKPTGVAVSASSESGALDVSWSKPGDLGTGTPTGYDVRYYAGSADPADEADWVEARAGLPDDIGPDGVSAAIRGLLASTAYRVQVRAVTGAGKGEWSDSAGASTASPPSANNAPRLLDYIYKNLPKDICKLRADPNKVIPDSHSS